MGVDEDWYLKREGCDEEHHLTALIKNKEKLIVGRIPCQVVDIVCDSQTVSRKHCELFFRNGQWEVYAFKKKTTFINKEPVPPEVLTPLLSNDKLGIGTVMKSRKSDYVFHLYKTVREASTPTILPHLTSESTNESSSSERAVYIQTGRKSIFVDPELLKDPKLSMRTVVSLSKCSIPKPKRNKSRKSSSKKQQPCSSNPPSELNNVENAEKSNGPMIWIPMDGLEQLNNTTLPPPTSTSTLPKQTNVQSLQDEVQPGTAVPLPCVKKEKKGKSHLPSSSFDQAGPSNLPNVPHKMIHQPPVVIDIADSDSESEKENSAKQKQEKKVFTFEKYSSGQVVVQPAAAQNDHPVVPSCSPVTPPSSSVDINELSPPEPPPRLLATADSPHKQNDQESSQSSSDGETEETPEERLQKVKRKLENRKCEQKTTKLTEAQSYSRHRGHLHIPLNSSEHDPNRRRRISSEKKSTENLRENFKKAYHMDGRALAAKAPPTKKAKVVAHVVSAPVPNQPLPTKNNSSLVHLPSSSHLAQQAPATSQSNQSATVPPKPVTVKAKVTSNTRTNQLLNSMNVNDNTQTNKPAAPLAQKRFLEGDGSSRSSAAPPLKKPMIESEHIKGIPPKVNFQAPSPTKKFPPTTDPRRTSAEMRPQTSSTNGPVPARIGNSTDSRRASTDTRPLTSSTNGPAPAKIGNGIGAKRASTETNPLTLATPVSIGIDVTSVLGYSLNPATSPHPSPPIIPAVRHESVKFPKHNNGSTDPAKFRRSPNKGPGYSRQP